MVHVPTIFDAFPLAVEVESLILATLLVLLLALAVYSGVRRAADGGIIPDARITLRNIIEVLLQGTASLARDVIGEKWATYMPLVGTLGFFILVSNLVGLLPGLGGPTSFIETNLAWAIIAVVVSEFVGFRERGLVGYLNHFAPGPWWIKPLTFPIEIISHLVRLLSLTVRLTANMFADHTLLALFLTLGYAAFVTPWIVMGLGVFVAFIQAFIFSFLTMIYIGLALEEAHWSRALPDPQGDKETPMHKMTAFALAFLASVLAPEVAGAADGTALIAVGSGLAIGLAALGGGIGQGLAVANTVQGISRNPGAAGAIQTPMIIGLALIESLVLFGFLIAFIMQGNL